MCLVHYYFCVPGLAISLANLATRPRDLHPTDALHHHFGPSQRYPALDIMSTYESLRRQCRTLEALVNDKLTGYSRLAVTLSSGQPGDLEQGSAERWSDMEEEIEGLLEKVVILPYLHNR